MAVLTLTSSSPAWTIPTGETVRVNGTSGADELIISGGANVTLDPSFNLGGDTITFSGLNADDFEVYRSGATVFLSDGAGTLLEIPAGMNANTLVFADTHLDLVIDVSGGTPQILLGDQAITDTPAPVDPEGGGGGDGMVQSIDVGTQQQTVVMDASTDSFIFTDDATVANFVQIDNFMEDDVIQVSNGDGVAYSFTNDGADVVIVANEDGVVNEVTLTGVVDAAVLVYDEASFEAAIGFNAFQMA